MDDPREQEAPDDPIERIHAFALDLAYGAVVAREWKTEFRFYEDTDKTEPTDEQYAALQRYLSSKWKDIPYPELTTLRSFGYAEGEGFFILTPKAIQLLESPYVPPKIFISYARPHSSAFGLLIVSRLQQVGVEHPFIDMNIDPGDEWHVEIQNKINSCKYFVLLISPASQNPTEEGSIVELATLDRPNVQHEIRLVKETDATIIPVWHNGFSSEKDYPDEFEWLGELNAIIVEKENPDQYQSAVDKLRNRMGYAPR